MQRVLLAVSALVFLGACGGGGGDGATSPTPPPASTGVASVSVALSATQITVGGGATATAELRTAAGAVVAGRAVSWTSSAPTVAAVNDAGTITALAAGSATITATSEGKSGAASLTVIPAPVATMQVTLALPSLTLGATTTASAVLRDERGATLTGRAVVWSSSAPAVATVDIGGAITTLAVGATVITATSEGKSASATLTVTPVPVATVSVAGAATLAPGAVGSFTATLRDASGAALSNRVVTWTSSDANVAAVSASGTVTAIAPGTATITATSEGKSGSTALTVRYNIATVTFTGSSRLKVGDSYPYIVTARLSDGTVVNRPVTWGIVETARAVVTGAGVVTPLQAGSFTIRAVIDGEAWTGSYTAYDWTTFTAGGASFAVLEADASVIGRRGISTRPDLVIACSNTSGLFAIQVDTREFITENGTIAYSFDGVAPVTAVWRELPPEYETLYHPGPNGSTKVFASQIAASRQFGFAFTEFLGTAKATIFRVTGLTPLLSPLLTQCPSNAIVGSAPGAGANVAPPESAAARLMAEYDAVRGRATARTLSPEAAARARSGPGADDRPALLRQWPVWTGTTIESQQAKRLR